MMIERQSLFIMWKYRQTLSIKASPFLALGQASVPRQITMGYIAETYRAPPAEDRPSS